MTSECEKLYTWQEMQLGQSQGGQTQSPSSPVSSSTMQVHSQFRHTFDLHLHSLLTNLIILLVFFFRPELEQKNHLFTQIVIQSTGDRICFIKTRTTTTGNSPCINFTNRRSSINRLEGKMTYKEGHMHRFLRRWVSLRFASGHLFL